MTTSYTDEQVKQFLEMIGEYKKDKNLSLNGLIEKVHSEAEKQIRLLKYLRDVKDLDERIERENEMYRPIFDNLEKQEKRVKKFLKKFFKEYNHFEPTTDLSSFDAVLILDKADLKTFHVVLRCDFDMGNDYPESMGSCEVIYLKNTNPHDSRKTSRGFVMRSFDNACPRNYTI